MILDEAREILGLGLKATRKEIRAAYRRAARRWHPDRAPHGAEREFRARMQEINGAYQHLLKFLEDYRFHLVESAGAQDYRDWWHSRFYTGVWGPPPAKDAEEEGD